MTRMKISRAAANGGGRILGSMKSPGTFRLFAGKTLLVCCALMLGGYVLRAVPAVAQQRGPVQRVVQGKVTDKSDAAIKGAVVYLKDGRSLAVKSYITDDQGGYRFGQLAQGTDYEVWAESNGKKSAVKSISSFDTKNQFLFILKIDTGK